MYSIAPFEFSTLTFPAGPCLLPSVTTLPKTPKLTPFFSHSCALPLPQPLSFDILPHCPGVCPLTSHSFALARHSFTQERSSTPFFSSLCTLFLQNTGVPPKTQFPSPSLLLPRSAPRLAGSLFTGQPALATGHFRVPSVTMKCLVSLNHPKQDEPWQ